ncbi:Hypp5247 [Branchiostoma lanceolatum]|uniref:Hypp5247 protein n=1 Tax=Branchiostoma lanceolatum TaxID=7740 RepID=A0A8K0AEP1_BRALA|nr:Hypp5247 [Branchiostoma lanceolatum]
MQEVVKDDTASCKSLPAILNSGDSIYCKISDDDNDNDGDGHILPYAAVAEPSLIEVRKDRENRQAYGQSFTANCHTVRCTTGMHIVAYGVDRKAKTHHVTFYEDCPWAQDERANAASRSIFGDHAATGDVRTYVNTADASGVLSVSQGLGPTLTPKPPDTYWPREFPREGPRNTPNRASLSTLPNTYWPWEIPGNVLRNTPRRASFPKLPSTYWP